jgi:S1-C subfamily serine protease
MRHLPAFVVCLAFFTQTADAAEMRTWTAASGGFTIEAELVEVKGDVARLKTKDGRVLDVPLAQLSAADQAFARPAPAGGAAPVAGPGPIAASTTMPEKPSAAFLRALKAADRCRNPEEAIVALKVFYDDPQHAPEERAYAAGRIAECQDAAAKKLVRVNKKWVAKEEADAVRKKADELMRQGLHLYKFNEDAFKRKFTEAAAMEPEEIRAEFLMGLVYTFGRQGGKALPIFQKCLVRDPENIAVLNNVAMLAAAKGDFNAALSHWRRALDAQPDQRVVHNIGRFLEQCTKTTINVPKTVRDGLSLPYAELTASNKFEETDGEVGWLLMLIEKSDLDISVGDDDDDKKQEQKSPAPEPNDDGTVIGSGTGFVVAPGYVLTNEHVAMDDAGYEIQAPDGTRHKATRVAADKDLDLALLKCEPLTAPALVLHDAIVPRGTDVMLFGYPEMLVLGASLKATRGSISSLPDPPSSTSSRQGTSSAVNSKYLYDAVSNAGNSGGPLCDAGANVVAVHSTGYNTASRYAGGIPSTQALEFVKKSLPDFQASAPSSARLEWPKVDERASASTMLIWIRKKNAKVETASLGGDVVELPFCLFCGGTGKTKCNYGGCRNGRVGNAPCPTCEGKAFVDCAVCGGVGIDVELASVQRALARAALAKAADAGSPNPASGTPNPSTGTSNSAPPQEIVATNLRGEARVGDRNSAGTGKVNYLDSDPGVRVAPTQVLNPLQVPQIRANLRGSPDQIKTAAKYLYTAIPDPSVQASIAQLLVEDLKHGDWSVRREVVRALETWNLGGRPTYLEAATDDESWLIRELACYALLHIGDVQSIGPFLRRLSLDPNSKSSKYDARRERALAVRCLVALGPAAKREVERFRNDPATNYHGKCAAEEVLQAYAAGN